MSKEKLLLFGERYTTHSGSSLDFLDHLMDVAPSWRPADDIHLLEVDPDSGYPTRDDPPQLSHNVLCQTDTGAICVGYYNFSYGAWYKDNESGTPIRVEQFYQYPNP